MHPFWPFFDWRWLYLKIPSHGGVARTQQNVHHRCGRFGSVWNTWYGWSNREQLFLTNQWYVCFEPKFNLLQILAKLLLGHEMQAK
jgi:hypothetical protein